MKKSSAKEPKAKLIVAETEIFEKIREIIIEQKGVSESSVTSKAAIADELGVDSLDMIEIIMALEEEFDIEISDTDAESFKTVGDIEVYIKSKIQGV
ncbi:MAG: acyl carrier protein [Lachnospiraceae bacterium]|nr:acyl carrier protein [Lachnospiraceae bacterium]